MNVKWTKAMVDKLVDMYISGETIENIAEAVGMPVWGCYEKLKSIGIRSPERDLRRECRYCGKPFTTKALHGKMYCSEKCKRAAKQRRQNARTQSEGQQQRTRPYPLIREYTETTDLLIAQFLMEGYDIRQIAEMLGRDADDLQRHIQEARKIIELWQRRLTQQRRAKV
jgi:hypothetical protein